MAVVSESNPEFGEELTVDTLASAQWVFTFESRSAFTPARAYPQQLGIETQVAAVVEGFLMLPRFIQGTNSVGLLQSHLARTN